MISYSHVHAIQLVYLHQFAPASKIRIQRRLVQKAIDSIKTSNLILSKHSDCSVDVRLNKYSILQVKTLNEQNRTEEPLGECPCAKNMETKSLLNSKRSSRNPTETANSASSSQRRASLQSNKKSLLKSKISTERKSLQ